MALGGVSMDVSSGSPNTLIVIEYYKLKAHYTEVFYFGKCHLQLED